MHGVAQHQLGHVESVTTYPNRCLPDCCFQESGIVELAFPKSFHRIGFAACMSCQQLQIVDLSQTDIIEILGSTFAYCSQLQQLCLPRMLRTIEQEAFCKCISLKEVFTRHPCCALRGIPQPLAQGISAQTRCKAVELGGSRRLLKEKKFSPGLREVRFFFVCAFLSSFA